MSWHVVPTMGSFFFFAPMSVHMLMYGIFAAIFLLGVVELGATIDRLNVEQ